MLFCFFHVSCEMSKIETVRSMKKFNFTTVCGVAKFQKNYLAVRTQTMHRAVRILQPS
jgi:hypothetical protein